jgi:hypothetical protein
LEFGLLTSENMHALLEPLIIKILSLIETSQNTLFAEKNIKDLNT